MRPRCHAIMALLTVNRSREHTQWLWKSEPYILHAKGQGWDMEDCNQCNSKSQEAFTESFGFKTISTQY